MKRRFDPDQVGWRLGRAQSRAGPASCGAATTAPPASTASKAPARPSTCSPRRCSPHPARRWSP